jgi:uncharacterized membrane protein
MPQSAPTPFDIVDIPHIPWQPGLKEWLILTLVFTLTVLVARWRTVRHHRRSRRGIVNLLLSDIESAARAGTARDVERISHLARRIVEFVSGAELSTLSPRELTSLAERSHSPHLQKILTQLAALEELVYEPPSAEHNQTITASSVRLAAALKEYVQEERRR